MQQAQGWLSGSGRRLSWALYDWANSAFATTVMAGFFPIFFRQFWSAGADAALTTFRLGMANAAAGLVIALLAPLLGAIADRGGHRKRMLLAFSLLGICHDVGAVFSSAQGQWLAAALLFALGTLGFNGGVVFYDALLLDVAQPADYDRVSALGYALGYLGGGVLFAINVLMVVKPALFGLPDAAAAVRWSFVTVAAWWLVFMLPLLLYVREAAAAGTGAGGAPSGCRLARAASAPRARCARSRMLLAVPAGLLAVHRWRQHHHQDGGELRHGARPGKRRPAGCVAADAVRRVSGIAGVRLAWRAHRRARRRAARAWPCMSALTVWAYFLDSALEFYLMAATLGLVQGGVQSLSRSMFGRLVPAGQVGGVLRLLQHGGQVRHGAGAGADGRGGAAADSTRASILALLLLFVPAALLLWRVRFAEQLRAQRPAMPQAPRCGGAEAQLCSSGRETRRSRRPQRASRRAARRRDGARALRARPRAGRACPAGHKRAPGRASASGAGRAVVAGCATARTVPQSVTPPAAAAAPCRGSRCRPRPRRRSRSSWAAVEVHDALLPPVAGRIPGVAQVAQPGCASHEQAGRRSLLPGSRSASRRCSRLGRDDGSGIDAHPALRHRARSSAQACASDWRTA